MRIISNFWEKHDEIIGFFIFFQLGQDFFDIQNNVYKIFFACAIPSVTIENIDGSYV